MPSLHARCLASLYPSKHGHFDLTVAIREDVASLDDPTNEFHDRYVGVGQPYRTLAIQYKKLNDPHIPQSTAKPNDRGDFEAETRALMTGKGKNGIFECFDEPIGVTMEMATVLLVARRRPRGHRHAIEVVFRSPSPTAQESVGPPSAAECFAA